MFLDDRRSLLRCGVEGEVARPSERAWRRFGCPIKLASCVSSSKRRRRSGHVGASGGVYLEAAEEKGSCAPARTRHTSYLDGSAALPMTLVAGSPPRIRFICSSESLPCLAAPSLPSLPSLARRFA
jgi:hypothetical protein